MGNENLSINVFIHFYGNYPLSNGVKWICGNEKGETV